MRFVPLWKAPWFFSVVVATCLLSCERPRPNYVQVLIDVPARDVQEGVEQYFRSAFHTFDVSRSAVVWLNHDKVKSDSPEWVSVALWDVLYVKTDGVYEIRTRRLDDVRLTSLQFTALGTEDLARRARRELDQCIKHNKWVAVGPPAVPSDRR